jgi:hypothetical protein
MSFERKTSHRYHAPGESIESPRRLNRVQRLAAKVALVGSVFIPIHAKLSDHNVDRQNIPPITAEMKGALTNNPMYEKAHNDNQKAAEQAVTETVDPGETAWEIADKYVDDEHDIRPVATYINDQGKNGVLMAGQQVEIPEKMISEDSMKPHNG